MVMIDLSKRIEKLKRWEFYLRARAVMTASQMERERRDADYREAGKTAKEIARLEALLTRNG